MQPTRIAVPPQLQPVVALAQPACETPQCWTMTAFMGAAAHEILACVGNSVPADEQQGIVSSAFCNLHVNAHKPVVPHSKDRGMIHEKRAWRLTTYRVAPPAYPATGDHGGNQFR